MHAIEVHSDGLQAAAVTAGPDTAVPSCPGWTVHRLVRHIARVHSSVVAATNDPSGTRARGATAPEEWDALLAWWEEQRKALRTVFSGNPQAPAWLPFPAYPPTVSSWARRMAHEAAIHRLDAELARGGDTVLFDPAFAADGIDELLTMMLPQHHDWSSYTADGTVLLHADNADRQWAIRLAPGQPPQLVEPSREPDVTIEGTADSLYRAVWRRPTTATITGDPALLEPLSPP